MSNKYLEKVALMINPAKPLAAVAAQARRIENRAVQQQLSARRMNGHVPGVRMQQLGNPRVKAGVIRINAEQLAKR